MLKYYNRYAKAPNLSAHSDKLFRFWLSLFVARGNDIPTQIDTFQRIPKALLANLFFVKLVPNQQDEYIFTGPSIDRLLKHELLGFKLFDTIQPEQRPAMQSFLSKNQKKNIIAVNRRCFSVNGRIVLNCCQEILLPLKSSHNKVAYLTGTLTQLSQQSCDNFEYSAYEMPPYQWL